MATPEASGATLRVTVVLGSSESSRPLLDALLPLVRGRSAEVLGLFVEDDELLRLAALPFSQELCRLTLVARRLDPAEIERQFRLRARLARRALESALGVEHARYSFRSVRGRLAALLASEAGDMDVLILGPSHPPFGTLPRAYRQPAPVAVVCSSSAAGTRALGLAARLAEASQRPLAVLALPAADGERTEIGERIAALGSRLPTTLATLSGTDSAAIAATARRVGAQALVLEARPELVEDAGLSAFRDRLDCPVVIVR
jgi:hypothetical protein